MSFLRQSPPSNHYNFHLDNCPSQCTLQRPSGVLHSGCRCWKQPHSCSSHSQSFGFQQIFCRIQSPSSILGRTTSPRGRTTSTSSPELPTTALSTNLLEIPFLIPPPPSGRGAGTQHSEVVRLAENAPKMLSLMT